MTKKRRTAASSSGSPMATNEKEPASSKTQIAPFATSELGRSTIKYAKLAAEYYRDGDHVQSFACAIIAAQCLQAYKLLNPAPKSANHRI